MCMSHAHAFCPQSSCPHISCRLAKSINLSHASYSRTTRHRRHGRPSISRCLYISIYGVSLQRGWELTFTIHLIVAEEAFVSVAIAPDKKAFSLFHALSELSNEPTAISCPLFKSTVSILQVILPAAPIQRPICLPQCCYATCLSFLPFALIYISIDSAYQSTIEVKHVFREVAFVKTAIWKHLEAVAFFLAVS